jgi:peptidoglycan/xylan/chitin deacetylase (PgdA/CDA1 family)
MSANPKPRKLVYLMYHELEVPGRSLCDSDPGYVRYIVHGKDFTEQINWLKAQGLAGLSVEQAQTEASVPSVAITFDDGAETDLIAAAPVLINAGFGATFYITAGFLGKRGYLSPLQVRELADLSFDIGCHSQTHPYLSDLKDSQLKSEIADPKLHLEDIIARPVNHFSCPGGRWDERVARAVKAAGYQTMATSQARANTHGSDPFGLGRVAVMRDTPFDSFQNFCAGRGLWKLQMAELARSSAKSLLGNGGYDRLRALLLHRSESRQ